MKNTFLPVLLISGTMMLSLPLAFADSAFPKTASCPLDSGTAHSTGKTRKAMQSSCTEVEYKHKGTDYSDPRHPQKFNHVFWITHCTQ